MLPMHWFETAEAVAHCIFSPTTNLPSSPEPPSELTAVRSFT